MRQRPDRITGVLVTILYVCFANKNLGAIRDVTFEHARWAERSRVDVTAMVA